MDAIDQMNTMTLAEANIHSHIECHNDLVSHEFWKVITVTYII